MFRGNPDIYQLIFKKEEKALSPCIICYSFSKDVRNYMRTYPSQIEWKPSKRPYHFEMPDNFELENYVEVGFESEHFRRRAILQYVERVKNKMRFLLEAKEEHEKVFKLGEEIWVPIEYRADIAS